jgi:hypothetical protein
VKKLGVMLVVVGTLFFPAESASADHERYRCMDHDYCGGDYYEEGDYEDSRGSRNGRDKRTCFFGCDNIIVIPGLPGGLGGGGEEGGREGQR